MNGKGLLTHGNTVQEDDKQSAQPTTKQKQLDFRAWNNLPKQFERNVENLNNLTYLTQFLFINSYYLIMDEIISPGGEKEHSFSSFSILLLLPLSSVRMGSVGSPQNKYLGFACVCAAVGGNCQNLSLSLHDLKCLSPTGVILGSHPL